MTQARGIAIDIGSPVELLPCYLTLPEAAAYLRRSVRALSRWKSLGLLNVTRPAGGKPLIERAEIQRLLREGLQ